MEDLTYFEVITFQEEEWGLGREPKESGGNYIHVGASELLNVS